MRYLLAYLAISAVLFFVIFGPGVSCSGGGSHDGMGYERSSGWDRR